MGCSKCKKECTSASVLGKLDYSGFDRQNWPKRSNQQHRADVNTVLSCKTKTQREKESELGSRYSALLDLPYFDPVRMTIVDPMHNLFLGTSKRFMSVLFDTGKLSKEHLTSIQEIIVNSVNVPDGVGRIPWKIQSGFSRLTAEQWRNWTVIYSIVALKNTIK